MKKKDSKKAKDKKIAIIIVLGTFSFYYVIGYLFNTDIFTAFTNHKNGMSISIIGITLIFSTSLLIAYITNIIKKYVDKKKQ